MLIMSSRKRDVTEIELLLIKGPNPDMQVHAATEEETCICTPKVKGT